MMFLNKTVVVLIMWHTRRWRIIPLLQGSLDCHVVWRGSLKMETQISFETSVPVCPAATLGHISKDHSPHRQGLANLSSRVRNSFRINPLNPELNPICHLLALLAHHFLQVSRIRVKSLTLRLLMPYTYGAPILDVSRSHTTTHHSR